MSDATTTEIADKPFTPEIHLAHFEAELEQRAVDEGQWDGSQAMSNCASADDPAAAYADVCAGRREGDPALQSTWALPHHMRPGMPPNADGVRNGLSRLPQTDGLTNAQAAEAHLRAHLENDVNAQRAVEEDGLVTMAIAPGELEVRSVEERVIGALIVPWDDMVDTPIGLEVFKRGAFREVDPKKVVLRLEHDGPPAGRGVTLEDRAEGAYMTFKVSKTSRGDEILTLARDGVTRNVSVTYDPSRSESEFQTRAGRRFTALTKVDLREVSTTWKPYYERAAVMEVRSQSEGVAAMADQPEAAQPVAAAPDLTPVVSAMQSSFDTIGSKFQGFADSMSERMEKLEERARSQFVVPGTEEPKATVSRGKWMQNVLKSLGGERVSELEMRAMADLVTADNLGVVPEAFSTELIGIIDPGRPFLNSTRRVPTPDGGMTLNMPVITTRPTAGVQSDEKTDIASTETSITSVGFDAITIAGGGDISLQLLKRSSPSYLNLYFELLAEALSENAEAQAVSALLGAAVTAGTTDIDPDDLAIGEAWVNAQAVKQRADKIWLSTEAVAAFLDAKASGTNAPLYSSLVADFTVGGGVGGRISGLLPVYVPALDNSGVDVIVGPSRGFAWAEDGAFNLQVDVPGKAGRDVALVVIDWFAPLYPAAFTTYSLAS